MSNELSTLRQLIKIEKEEDLKQYRELVLNSSVSERVQNGTTWYPIKITHTGIGRGEQVFIELERTINKEIDHRLQTGQRAALFCNVQNNGDKCREEGVIGTLTKNNIRIFLNCDELPDWIKDGKLGVDMLFDESTYKEMDETLKKVLEAKNNRLADLREILLGNKVANFTLKHPTYISENSLLNQSQREAIARIEQAEDVAIVHGPPGTGKTTTFVEAIKIVAQSEKQVLVTAASNTAVDLLVERLSAKGLKVLRIGHPARVNENSVSLTLDAQIANHPYYADIRHIRKQSEELKTMAFKYKRNFGRAEAEQRKLVLQEARSMKMEAIKLEEYITADVLSTSEVIACTLTGANNRVLEDRVFHTVFIDEAAQALEPACWIPIMKATRVIMAGDHCQLPPTVKSYEAAKQGLSITLFEKIIKRQQVSSLLNVQYRMNAKIMEFSNQQFYEGKLKADDSVSEQLFDGILFENPLEFIDTAGCSFEEKSNANKSLVNPLEADLLLKHLNDSLEYMDMEGFARQELSEWPTVAVISPYKGQVNYIKENVLNYPLLERYASYITINTIDGFQGQEKDIVFISLVRSNEQNEIGFLSDTRRMNVAMTRAKRKLVMIGDSSTLGNHSFYASLLDYVQKENSYKSAWELM